MFQDMLMSARIMSDDRWVTAENEGGLLLFFPSEVRNGVKTSQGVSDAVLCHRIVNLDTGAVYENALVFGAALVPNVGPGAPGSAVLGRLAKTSRGAWVLDPHSQEDLYLAHHWMKENNA